MTEKTNPQAEVQRLRAELAATVDQLSERISPSYQMDRAKATATRTAQDVRTLVTGGGLPKDDPARARNVKVALGTAGAVVALIALQIIKGTRH
ncbi:MAG: DUF3618 domain-containing protein [Promicromonosporaceae bacterium]|nr:DUF3618 domain-containing protein [Promicromonosporaceae bacterium]